MEDTTRKATLVNYVKKNISKGYKPESLRWALVSQGYSRIIIDDAFKQATKELDEEDKKIKLAQQERDKPKIEYQAYDENDHPLFPKKAWWKKLFKIK